MSIKHGMLSLLAQRSMHGYQLRAEFEQATGSTWPLNVGQVYTTLSRLERDGLISEVESAEENQRLYAITDAGRAEVDRWFHSPVSSEPPRDELAIKMALAVRNTSADVSSIVQIQRAATVKALQDYTRARERAGDDLSWRLVVDGLIFHAEAEVRWLDHCEAALIRAQRQQVVVLDEQPTQDTAVPNGESALIRRRSRR